MNKSLLIIGFVWPEPKSSAAGSRMMQLIETFKVANYKITFASAAQKNKNTVDLAAQGIDEVLIQLNHSSFNEFIKQLHPDVVLFDRFMTEEQFGWRVAEQSPNAFRILDTEDLHCLRKGRHQALKDNQPFNNTYLFNDVAKREIASIYRSDLSLIISQAEIKILNSDFKIPEQQLHYLPFMLSKVSKQTVNHLPQFENRQHFITIGNFLHEPNYNAVLYLKQIIWPLIRKHLPKAELHIYGAYSSQKVEQLHNDKEKFLIKGFVKDANQVMQQAKVCLAPLRFGAGLKGKLVDAMQNGTPCVMSTIAAEGMFGSMKANGFIEDSSVDFVNKAVELYNNASIWKKFQHNGFIIIDNRFNKKLFQTRFIKKIDQVLAQKQELRLDNFTGQMLLHHSMQSTKFMSRWIEEKNK